MCIRDRANWVSELVADGAQQGSPVADVGVGLDTDRWLAVDNADDAATPRGDGDEDVHGVRGGTEDRADLGDGFDGVQDVQREPVPQQDHERVACLLYTSPS